MNNPSGAGMPPQQTSPVVTKRRSRKKKPVEIDPEAERQEAELRAKIKASLHTQQASRKEFEDDEANQNQSVLNSKMISAMHNSAASNNMNNNMGNGTQMNNMMHMTNMMEYMSQMGGMGMGNMMQNNQYAQQMYGQYNQNNNMMGMGTTLSEAQMNNLELQMQQMKQQLEFQKQQLEQQMKMKQQMEMQQQMEGGGMQQQNQQYPNNGNMDCSGGIDNNNLNAQYQQQNCSPQPQMLQTNPQFHQPQSPHPGGIYTNQQTQYSPNNNVSYNQQNQQQQQQQQSPYNISYNQQQLSESQQSYNPLPFKNQQNNNDSQYNNTNNEPIVELTSSNEKSLALSSGDESWLKGSVGFHSVGNMSASFNSMGGGMLDNSLSQQNMPNNVVVESSGETLNETSIEGSPQTVDAVQRQAQAALKTEGSGATTSQTNNNKHAAYTDSIAGLKPIQENEADEGDNKFGQSSLMLSLLEGEFMQSVTDDGMNPVMSLDSTTIEALMKKSQSGTDTSLSFADLIRSANTDQTASTLTHKLTSSEQQQQQQGSAHVSFAAQQASGSTNKDVNESHSSNDPSSSSSHSNNSQYLQIKMGGSSSSIHSSVSMEDAQKDNPPPSATAQMAGATTNRRGSNESGNNKESGASDLFAKRGSRASKKKSISKANVMSSISQWTSDNPFAEADANDDLYLRSQNNGGGDGQSGQPVGQLTSKRLSQSEYSFDMDEDMGNFNSVGASINSLDISMMSAMTDEIGDSMRGLDISGRSEFMRKQSK